MSVISVHDDWLSLIEISGPFLAVPVLKEAFPQGLEQLDATKRKRLRQAYDEWREALELEDAQFAELHAAWIDEVLSRGLELDEHGKGDVLKRADWCNANLHANLPEHGVTLSPDLAVIDEQRTNKPLLLIQSYAPDVDLDATLKFNGWSVTPADYMVQLCRSMGCRLGLVTNGERWMLVDAPVGAVSTFASWYARIWSQEPITLQAFVHLLGIRRFFVDESEQLPALFDRSLKFQDEVTDALGEQVRRAVEVLIQTLDKADLDRNRELLHDVKEPELYEAALTVMMRLVFLLSAEERGLLLMGDECYEANYALSTLRMQLRQESEEILERRWDAWSRLLAIFRAVFGGIEHENLRMPALGGSLFDPDRFPFLEGRAKGSNWRTDAAKPLPIDNRTVLMLLEAIQQFQGRTLSYRALDIEQIGYVYEGLLERTVKRTNEVTLDLSCGKNANKNIFTLKELDILKNQGIPELIKALSGPKALKRAESAIRNDLSKPVVDTLADSLLTVCLGNTDLSDRIKPYVHLLRTDPWGYPLVYPAGAFIVTTGSERRETGTHYTPKILTEAIVTETLTPVAYVGAAEELPRDQWVLKSSAELLDLKICDPAMGSGAFLVQACRWLAERVVESWSQAEASGKTVSVDGEVVVSGFAKEPLPRNIEARTVIARRLIAERCLYGVDLNPLAVELAKLSIWLVTLAKGRPFGFLDHNLRSGDSLLGIHRLDQLTELSMTPGMKGQRRLFGQNVEQAVHEAISLRLQLRAMHIRDIRDVESMARLDAEARRRLEPVELLADAMIGEAIRNVGDPRALHSALDVLATFSEGVLARDKMRVDQVGRDLLMGLAKGVQDGQQPRKTLHWPLAFPEVMLSSKMGFDCVIGNPPWLFLSGKGSPVARMKKEGQVANARRLEIDIEYYSERFSDVSQGAKDYFKWFVGRATEITGDSGSTTLLLPSSFLSLPKFKDVRTKWCIFKRLDLIDLGFGFFSAFVSCAIASGRSKRNQNSIPGVDVRYSDLKQMGGGMIGSINMAHHNQSVPLSMNEGDLQIFRSDFAANVYETCRHRLGEVLDIREGNHQISILGDGIEVPMVLDSTMERFLEPQIGRGFVETLGNCNFHLGERFILRKTGDQLLCAMVPTRNLAIAHQNVYVCKSLLPERISTTALCALLTSSIMTRLYQDGPLGQKGRPMAQLRITGLKNLPIPTPEKLQSGCRQLELAYKSKDIDGIDAVLKELLEGCVVTD